MSESGNAPASLARVPWNRVALGYAIGMALVELAAFFVSPALFRAVLVGDAAVGWTVVFASWQGLRAVPFPPPMGSMLVASLATGHWLAAVLGAVGAIGALAQ